MIEFFTAWWSYGFMRNAFIAILIITPLFGILGTMIVNNKMAFFSDALGHSALTGIALGVVMGVADTTLSMIIFAVIFALLLNYISSKASASRDTIISVFLRHVLLWDWHLIERWQFQQIFQPFGR